MAIIPKLRNEDVEQVEKRKITTYNLDNDWNIEGRCVVALPSDATHDALQELYTITVEDGQIKIVEVDKNKAELSWSSNTVAGDVKVWDTNSTTAPTETDLAAKSTGGVAWSKVLNKEYDFGGNWAVIENGKIAVALRDNVVTNNNFRLFIYVGGVWMLALGDRDYTDEYPIQFVKLESVSPNKVSVKLNYDFSGLTNVPGAGSYDRITVYGGKPIIEFESDLQGGTQWWDISPNVGNRFGLIFSPGDMDVIDISFYTSTQSYPIDGNDNYLLFLGTPKNYILCGATAKKQSGSFLRGVFPISGSFYFRQQTHANSGIKKWFIYFVEFDTSTLFKEAENGVLSGSAVIDTTQTDDSGDSVRLDNQSDQVAWAQAGADYAILPPGTYRVFFRLKDLNQVAGDVELLIHKTDINFVYQGVDTVTTTAAAAFDYYYMDIVVDGNTVYGIAPGVKKVTTAANSIWVDYFLIVPLTNGKNFPQDIAHDAMRISYFDSSSHRIKTLDKMLILPEVYSGDYGGGFATFTPPAAVKGGIFIAEDTNATTPEKRLYISTDGVSWNYITLL